MASIRDVAKKANVGATTVSRVLNGSGYVSEKTKNKIVRAMKELNYTPNELARQLYHKKTGIVAMLVPDVAYPLFAELVKHVESELYTYGYKTMICETYKEENCEEEYLEMLNRHMVDGIITGVHSLKIEKYLELEKPIVAFDRLLSERIPIVGVDHTQGGRLAAEILIEKGCKNVIQFQGAKVIDSPSHDRHTEFVRVMKAHGVKVSSYELKWNRFEDEYYEEVTKKIFEENKEADGVFGTDLLAIHYMKAAFKYGKRIPEDIKIVAYDGTYVTKLTTPTITSIVQPIDLLAKGLVNCICDLIEGNFTENKRITLPVTVRQGEST